ncbi:MAG: PAS domain S-box-containing protein [Candidatus Azotimanducaceae bacterium]|jgi:PAS domain S-box-containing protein
MLLQTGLTAEHIMTHRDDIENLIGVKNSRLGEMIDATPSCHKIVDSKGALLTMNQRGLHIIGAESMDAVLMADVYSLVAPAYRDEFIAFNQRVCQGATESLLFELISLKGEHRWMETWGAPYELENGETAQIAITNDVTERIEAEVTLAQQHHALALSSRLASIGELAAGVAHEINNPLCIIQGLAGALRMSLESGEFNRYEVLADLCGIEDTVTRISKIVKGLGTISRDVPAENRAEVSLVKLIDSSLSFSRERLLKDDIQVTVTGERRISAMINEIQMSQVLLNLLSNAIQAVRGLDDRWIKIHVDEIPSYLRISFTDSGRLNDADVIAKMMNPFFTTKDIGEGTGLGLSISQGIISSHLGQFCFDPQAKNTTFHIDLPAMSESQT